MKNNDVFNREKSPKSTKYFVLSFGLFVLILGVFSAVFFMKSIDFDFGNLTGETTTNADETTSNVSDVEYSVKDLTGKSSILFLCETKSGEMNFAYLISTDFDKKTMTVDCFDKDDIDSVSGQAYGKIYSASSVDGLQETMFFQKSIVVNENQFKEMLALFDEISIDIKENVAYFGDDFNLEISSGKQILSEDYILKYLLISSNSVRESVMCDIINAILIPQYTEDSQELFTDFINLCKTNISVIDYSNSVDTITVYANSNDKFFPIAK